MKGHNVVTSDRREGGSAGTLKSPAGHVGSPWDVDGPARKLGYTGCKTYFGGCDGG